MCLTSSFFLFYNKLMGNEITLFKYIKLVWGGESLRGAQSEDILRYAFGKGMLTMKGLDSDAPPTLFLEARYFSFGMLDYINCSILSAT